MAEVTANSSLNISSKDLQAMLESLVLKMKEPTELERAKMNKERDAFLKKEKEALAVAQAQVAREEHRRKNCSHVQKFKGQLFHGWQGQVHSDGLVRPVCKYCDTKWPPFSATLLPDGGKQGVNMEESNATPALLSEMHQKSFPGGCPRKSCFVCYPKK